MNGMLTDDVLERLLTEAAGTFDVPDLASLPGSEVTGSRPVWRRPGTQLGAVAAILVGAVLVLQLPSGTSGTTASKSPAETFARRTSDSAAAPAPKARTGLPGSPAVPQPASLTSGASAGSGDDARVVKTGTISLLVDRGRVSETAARVEALVVAPGYVSDSTIDQAGTDPSATITIRVPVGSFGALVQSVSGLGAKVVSATTGGRDVTATYADTQAKIQSLRAARSRYLAILAGARTIAETLTVQQRVDDVQGQIDELEAQRRVLADQSDFATLAVSVAQKVHEPLVAPTRTGWSKAWHDATHGFTGGLQALVARSGRALLVLLVGVAVFLLGRAGWRVARRRLV